ncbi:MAG: glycerate kinase [Candidatus Izemoplasmatales bacterium]|nr:glycerate kinase [Candidatus Izemoplasmatales bacterium]
MKILVAMDSFKGSLTATEACDAVEQGILLADKNIEVIKKPIADGGEGTVKTLVDALDGQIITLDLNNPLMRKIQGYYGIINNKTAIIEMAVASGLTLLEENERNPLYTTTYGVGEIIKDALNRGITDFIIAIGGSATNDGGIGMLNALGINFFDNEGKKLEPIGENLININSIDLQGLDKRLIEANFLVACDVNNPLYGPSGAAYIYGPQKGATKDVVKYLDEGLKNFSLKTSNLLSIDNSQIPGTGAAGGLGFALLSYLNATLKPGIEIVLDYLEIEKLINNVDLIITGEGKIDTQSKMGKVLSGLGNLGIKHNRKVIAFGGMVENKLSLKEYGISTIIQINRRNLSLADAMKKDNAKLLLRDSVKKYFKSKNA